MKKILKRSLAGVLASTFLMLSAVSVSASKKYDLENEAYRRYVDTLYEYHREEDLIFLFPEISEKETKHIYDLNKYPGTIVYEYGDETTRYFSLGSIFWGSMSLRVEYSENIDLIPATEEEISAFLEEKGMKAKLSTYDIYEHRMGVDTTISLSFDEDAELDDKIDIALALKKEYGFGQSGYYQTSSRSYSDTIVAITPTLVGDIDLNGEQGIADIALFTKYNTNPELFPIENPTALANADVNQDGEINSIDIGVLTEIMLGNYESAV